MGASLALFSPLEVTINTQHCKTFVCNNSQTTITNSYYTQTLGEAQGERGYRLNLASGITSSVTPMFGRLLSASSTTITKPFHRMNSEGSEIIPAVSSSIASMEGIFVEAGTDGETLTFSQATRATNDGEKIVVNLSRNNGSAIDRAIVRFGEGHTLPKFQLNPSHTKVYIPQDGKDYAVVSVGRDAKFCVSTEIPLNFKAEENGTYTLSFSLENMDLDYLHLIDNMTGADVDLLTPAGFPLYKGGQGDSNNTQTVSYTFTAKTTDYASRFRLVFSICEDANGDNEPFSYISNGNIIVDGEGTLQVVDVTGHVIVCRDASNASVISTSGMMPGVYVLRLINGDDVKTQKIVIE